MGNPRRGFPTEKQSTGLFFVPSCAINMQRISQSADCDEGFAPRPHSLLKKAGENFRMGACEHHNKFPSQKVLKGSENFFKSFPTGCGAAPRERILMKKFLNLLCVLCPVGAAVIIFVTVSEVFAWNNINNIIVLVLATVFAVATCVLCAISSTLYDKVKNLEDYLGIYVDRGYEQDEELPAKECPVCKKEIDFDYRICPHCGNREFGTGEPVTLYNLGEIFETENADYNGTDFSGEEVVSANFDERENDE